jgi:hypothetical protein
MLLPVDRTDSSKFDACMVCYILEVSTSTVSVQFILYRLPII